MEIRRRQVSGGLWCLHHETTDDIGFVPSDEVSWFLQHGWTLKAKRRDGRVYIEIPTSIDRSRRTLLLSIYDKVIRYNQIIHLRGKVDRTPKIDDSEDIALQLVQRGIHSRELSFQLFQESIHCLEEMIVLVFTWINRYHIVGKDESRPFRLPVPKEFRRGQFGLPYQYEGIVDGCCAVDPIVCLFRDTSFDIRSMPLRAVVNYCFYHNVVAKKSEHLD